MRHRHILLLPFFLLLLSFSKSPAQCLLYEVSLEERSLNATLIVEAKVIDQYAFQGKHGMIYTASTLKVSEIHKGQLPGNEVLLITPGGILGDKMVRVEPSLEPDKNQEGIFFLQPAAHTDQAKPVAKQFEPYASVQGLIAYDPVLKQPVGPFHTYSSKAVLKQQIQQLTGFTPILLEKEGQAQQNLPNKVMATPIISSFSPTTATAGTQTVLTITGSNFDVYDGGSNSAVFFRSADNGGASFIPAAAAQVLSWTDTEIQVEIPSGAGTGNIAVRDQNTDAGFSSGTLTIDFNQTNASTVYPTHLADDNGSGGYDIVFSTNTSNSGVNFYTSSALPPFMRALETWQCKTTFNVDTVGTTTSVTVAPHDAENIIMFDNAASPLPAGVLGRATSGFGTCNGTLWHVNGFDVVFRRDGTGGVTWNFGPAATGLCCYDFESVSVHELGHTHQLGHIISSGRVMHYSIANGTDARTLDPISDSTGGRYVMNISNGYSACFGSVSGMSAGTQCTPLSADFIQAEGEYAEERVATLKWEASLNLQGADFSILRSVDGQTWQAVGELLSPEGQGEVYTWTDDGFVGSRQLYRVKAHSLNGNTIYSNVVEIQREGDGWASRSWPNPFSNKIYVESLDQNGVTAYTLLSLTGKQLLSGESDAAVFDINTAKLHSGVYFLRLSAGAQQRYYRMVKP